MTSGPRTARKKAEHLRCKYWSTRFNASARVTSIREEGNDIFRAVIVNDPLPRPEGAQPTTDIDDVLLSRLIALRNPLITMLRFFAPIVADVYATFRNDVARIGTWLCVHKVTTG